MNSGPLLILDHLKTHNSSPATREKEVTVDEVLEPAGRAFFLDDSVALVSYITSGGDVVEDKLVFGGQYHPVSVRKFTKVQSYPQGRFVDAAEFPAGRPGRLWVIA